VPPSSGGYRASACHFPGRARDVVAMFVVDAEMAVQKPTAETDSDKSMEYQL
jgi:hypothetical protein